LLKLRPLDISGHLQFNLNHGRTSDLERLPEDQTSGSRWAPTRTSSTWVRVAPRAWWTACYRLGP